MYPTEVIYDLREQVRKLERSNSELRAQNDLLKAENVARLGTIQELHAILRAVAPTRCIALKPANPCTCHHDAPPPQPPPTGTEVPSPSR